MTTPYSLRSVNNTDRNFTWMVLYVLGLIAANIILFVRYSSVLPLVPMLAVTVGPCIAMIMMLWKLSYVRREDPRSADIAFYGVHIVNALALIVNGALHLIGHALKR